MTSLELFNAIQNSGFGVFIGKQDRMLWAVAQIAHIAGIILVLAPIVLISLRLFGFGLYQQPLPKLAHESSKLIWLGFGLLVVSGLLIFIPAALHYHSNPVFWIKLYLILAALFIQVTLYRWITKQEKPNPWLARSIAIVTLTLWFGVAFAGRFIGFV
ncbi:hypothetical protein LG198_05215 [Methylobacillus arboreus]|uniref:DUF6644 family protein n=1 Tax=Methylobacillus arboreus TaxID=755170 RepID=UPI001E4794CD|nr:DUF6644 family protein [Methylobacillus arboreus]MCB5190121.1 hypothetical protein [Methylobacillus arboreus]